MYLKQDTLNIQSKLARFCRTGKYTSINGINKDRIKHYRRLVFNNVNNTLKQAFPITLEWLNEQEWLMLVNSFFEHHDAQTPKIWLMPREFMEYVLEKKFSVQLSKPALNDLLLLEWIEIEVHTMPDVMTEKGEAEGDYLNDTLVLVPEYRMQRFDYPVHVFNADEAVHKKGDWYIYVFRNQETGVVQFLNISVLHTFILEKLYENSQPLSALLPYVSSIFGLTDILQTQRHLSSFISDLQIKGAIVGFIHTK